MAAFLNTLAVDLPRNEYAWLNVHYYCMTKRYEENLDFKVLKATKATFQVKISLSFTDVLETLCLDPLWGSVSALSVC